MATLRRRTGQPVTSRPFITTRPSVGWSSPAIKRISDVLPASVSPNSTLTEPAVSVSDTPRRWTLPSNSLLTASRTRGADPPPRFAAYDGNWLMPDKSMNAGSLGSGNQQLRAPRDWTDCPAVDYRALAAQQASWIPRA